MENVTEQAGGASTEASGVSDQVQDKDNTTTDDKANLVSKSDLDRALKDLHRYKSEAREKASKLEEMETEKLKQQNEYKALYEKERDRAKEFETKLQKQGSMFFESQKFNALKDEAMKAGIRPEALSDLELLSLDSVVVETTSTGRMQVLGADTFVEDLKRSKKHWFKNPDVPQVNAGGRGFNGSAGKLEYKDVMKLQKDAERSKDPAKKAEAEKAFLEWKYNKLKT